MPVYSVACLLPLRTVLKRTFSADVDRLIECPVGMGNAIAQLAVNNDCDLPGFHLEGPPPHSIALHMGMGGVCFSLILIIVLSARGKSVVARFYSFTKPYFLVFFCLMVAGHASATPPAIWGAKFSTYMTLNATGFISWFKIVNPGASDLEITADIVWTLADGTEGSASSQSLGTVDAGGIYTVSEATLLAAMDDPTQLVDVYITLTLPDPEAFVHAEKKASDGRVGLPVKKVYVLSDPAS